MLTNNKHHVIFEFCYFFVAEREKNMKNKHIAVNSEMRKRIKEEMKRNGQKNADIAEYLRMEPPSFSRILNGRSSLAQEYLKMLVELWDVRSNYLLCIDNFRTDDEIYRRKGEKRTAKTNAVRELLKVIGYETEEVELLVIKPLEMAKLENIDEELAFIEPHIISDKKLWDYVKKKVYIIRDDLPLPLEPCQNTEFCFEVSGVIEKLDENCIEYLEYEIVQYIGFYSRITENGSLVGYIGSAHSFYDVITDTVESMFKSLLKASTFKIKKNHPFYTVPDNTLTFN